MLEEQARIVCPYCGEPNTVLIDCTAGDQTYVEDCTVCCQPVVLRIALTPDGQIADVQADAENS